MYTCRTDVIKSFCVTGNSVSLAVLLGRTFRKSSVGFTLGALAVVDTAVLCTALPRQWILQIITDDHIDVRSLHGAVGCKLHFFLTYYLSHLFTCIGCLPVDFSPLTPVDLVFCLVFSLAIYPVT